MLFLMSSYWLTKLIMLKYSMPEIAAKLWRGARLFLGVLLLDSIAGVIMATANFVIIGSFISSTNLPKSAIDVAMFSLLSKNAPLRGLAAILRGV